MPYGNESTVTFTATVTPQFAGTPGGTVTVATGTTTLCSITLPAPSCSALDDALGASASAYPVTAGYQGDDNFSGSTSAARHLNVTPATTTTGLTLSASTVAEGKESTLVFTATVSPEFFGTPTGTVSVATGTTTLCTMTLPASTTCSMADDTLAPSGTPYPITASYQGDDNFSGSTSSPQDLTVRAASSSTSLTLSASSVAFGNESTVTFTSVVTTSSGTPTGTVTVATGSTTLCTIALPATTCATTDTALDAATNAYPVTAAYGGDATFGGSTSPTRNLTVDPATTTASLSLSAGSVGYGDESSVTFTSSVTPEFAGTPTGTVTVATGSTTLCTITLPATTCSPVDGALAVRGSPYPVTAGFGGDTNFSSSTSPSHGLTVEQATTSTSLSLSTSSVTVGNESTLVFTSVVTPQFGGTPSGAVTVATGTTTLCTISLPSASCSMADNTLVTSATAYPVTASYGGDTNFSASISSASDLTVTSNVSTSTSLSLSSPSVAYGDESSVTFTATVTPSVSGTPTGTVTVATGTTTLCTIALPAGTTCTMGETALNASSTADPVVATYGGDAVFPASSSAPVDLVVVPGTPSTPSITNIPGGATEEGSFVASVATDGDGPTSVVSSTTGQCTVGADGFTVSFLAPGSCTLTAQVGQGSNYTGATGSPQVFTILPGPRGYWLVGSDGGIFSFGAAAFHGSMGGIPLQRPVVGITPTATKHGYWLVASDGGIFSFGDSSFYGSIPALGLHPAGSGQPNSLSAPIVGMVPSSTGGGYFMVGSDGGVFAFGDAQFAGSCPGIGGCAGTAVAVMPDHSGRGYWLVTSAGAVYAFGDAPFFGTPPAQPDPVVDAVATPNGQGYWILFASGAVYSFGDAPGLGNPIGYVNGFNPATAIFPTSDGRGYWVAAAHGDVFSYGNAPYLGSMAAVPLNGPIIAGFGF